jgi:potassium/chloride transporter 4/5/6
MSVEFLSHFDDVDGHEKPGIRSRPTMAIVEMEEGEEEGSPRSERSLGAIVETKGENPIRAFMRATITPGAGDRKSKKAGVDFHPSKTPVPFQGNLGVLFGVYLPTVQHIFGVMLFIRLYWIVGVMGMGEGFAMICLCCLCVSLLSHLSISFQTFLTCISLSALATNGRIKRSLPFPSHPHSLLFSVEVLITSSRGISARNSAVRSAFSSSS